MKTFWLDSASAKKETKRSKTRQQTKQSSEISNQNNLLTNQDSTSSQKTSPQPINSIQQNSSSNPVKISEQKTEKSKNSQ